MDKLRTAIENRDRLYKEYLREMIARVICCFAKDNDSCVDCKENTHPDHKFPDCFTDIREETDQILKLLKGEK